MKSNPPSRDTLTNFTDAATEAIARTIANLHREGRREHELRDAQFAARMAELGSKISSVAELERRLAERLSTLKDGQDGNDGKSVTVEDVRPVVEQYVERVLAGWDRPKDGINGADGKSVSVDDLLPVVTESVERVLSGWERPKDGVDGADGTSVTLDDVEPVLRDMVSAAVAQLPAPKDGADGRDVAPEIVRQFIAEEVAKIPAPKDGRDGRDGKDGVDGADGVSVAPADVERMISEAVAALAPSLKGDKGDKGEKGDPGPMGSLLAVEDYQDRVYYEGEVVTLEGALYQAVRDTGKVPGHKDWRCIVRAGKDGQNGKPGAAGKKGDPGRAVAVAVNAVKFSDDGMLTLVNADGSTVQCDLYPVLSKLGG